MSKVVADISMSLDGYIAGPNDTPEQGLGEGGERLPEWVYGLASWRESHHMEGGETNPDNEIMAEVIERLGSALIGRRMFDVSIEAWGPQPPFEGDAFVLTHRADPLLERGSSRFHFVTDIDEAVAQAKAVAGEKDVYVSGGAEMIQQLLIHGHLDELQVHVVPLLLGQGRRLFDNMPATQIELDCTRVIASPAVTHLRYRVVK